MNVLRIVYLALVFTALIGSLARRKTLSRADRWICVLLLSVAVTETLAVYMIRKYHNSMALFHIYNPVELFIICLYFNESIPFFKRRNIGVYIGCLGILIAVMNAVWLQPVNTTNSIFLLFEAISIITCCLLAFYNLLMNEHVVILSKAQFWITLLFLLFWSFTFLYWGLDPYYHQMSELLIRIRHFSLFAINLITYSGFLIIFIRYRKMIPSGE